MTTADYGAASDTLANPSLAEWAAAVHTSLGGKAASVHQHSLEDVTDSGGAAALDVGTTAGTVAAGDHVHPAGWDDLRVDVTSGTKPNLNPPGFESFRDGILANAFAPGSTEQVYFDVQLPHNWLEGTGIRPHVHWSPGNSTNAGSVVWGLEYTWANAVNPPGNTFPASTTLLVTQAAAGVAYSHQIAQWTEIDGTGKRLSSVLMCRLFRVGGDVADTFTGDAFGLSVDFHIQVQGNGSEEEYPAP